jgi:hypothetical protein
MYVRTRDSISFVKRDHLTLWNHLGTLPLSRQSCHDSTLWTSLVRIEVAFSKLNHVVICILI